MTTAMVTEKEDDVLTEEELKRKFTAEERDALLEAVLDMREAGNDEEATRMLRRMPIHPRWAKIIADVIGKELLLENFNITHADEVMARDGWMANKAKIANLYTWAAIQVSMFEKRAQSRIEKQYGLTMQKSAAALMKFIPGAPFEQLIALERMFQKNDLTVYAQMPATVKSVERASAISTTARKCTGSSSTIPRPTTPTHTAKANAPLRTNWCRSTPCAARCAGRRTERRTTAGM